MANAIERAIRYDKTGEFCFFCGEKNDNADEAGWFHCILNNGDGGPACKKCYNGPIGDEHKKRYRNA